ncbi:MAG: hypothetical protein H7267_09090, partial [Sandarakinorhabdus sp.]|nr:hypothetical protein [Sandarakinorhabdus sp.]
MTAGIANILPRISGGGGSRRLTEGFFLALLLATATPAAAQTIAITGGTVAIGAQQIGDLV